MSTRAHADRLPIVVRTAVAGSCVALATGCGYNARDDFLARQDLAIAAKPGSGETVASIDSEWTTLPTISAFARTARADLAVEPSP